MSHTITPTQHILYIHCFMGNVIANDVVKSIISLYFTVHFEMTRKQQQQQQLKYHTGQYPYIF